MQTRRTPPLDNPSIADTPTFLRYAADHDQALIEVEVHDPAHLVMPCVRADSLLLADSTASALRA